MTIGVIEGYVTNNWKNVLEKKFLLFNEKVENTKNEGWHLIMGFLIFGCAIFQYVEQTAF